MWFGAFDLTGLRLAIETLLGLGNLLEYFGEELYVSVIFCYRCNNGFQKFYTLPAL